MIPTASKILSSQEIILGRRPIAATRRIALMSSVPESMTMTRLAADEDDSNQVIQEPNNNSTDEESDEKSGKRGKLRRFWRRIKRRIVSRRSNDPSTTTTTSLPQNGNAVGNVTLSEYNNDASFQEEKNGTVLPSQPEKATNSISQNGAAVGNVTLSEYDNDASSEEEKNGTVLPSQPEGTRWAISSNSTNLTGLWKPIITPEFKQQYDEYLQNCSQPMWFRNLVSNVLGTTREQVEHDNNSQELVLTSKNPAGEWRRTLLASGSEEPVYTALQDPDKDSVQVESWWEDQGTVHKSILRGKPRLKGGEFETVRYLEPNVDGSARDDIFVVESYFHPSPTTTTSGSKFRPGYVKWRFSRVN